MRNLTITGKDKNMMMMCCCCCMSDKKNRAYFSYATDTPERRDRDAQIWDWSPGKNYDEWTGAVEYSSCYFFTRNQGIYGK